MIDDRFPFLYRQNATKSTLRISTGQQEHITMHRNNKTKTGISTRGRIGGRNFIWGRNRGGRQRSFPTISPEQRRYFGGNETQILLYRLCTSLWRRIPSLRTNVSTKMPTQWSNGNHDGRRRLDYFVWGLYVLLSRRSRSFLFPLERQWMTCRLLAAIYCFCEAEWRDVRCTTPLLDRCRSRYSVLTTNVVV